MFSNLLSFYTSKNKENTFSIDDLPKESHFSTLENKNVCYEDQNLNTQCYISTLNFYELRKAADGAGLVGIDCNSVNRDALGITQIWVHEESDYSSFLNCAPENNTAYIIGNLINGRNQALKIEGGIILGSILGGLGGCIIIIGACCILSMTKLSCLSKKVKNPEFIDPENTELQNIDLEKNNSSKLKA